MSLFITSLNSGSNGNCYYIGNDTEAVLIDAGLSCKETEKRMKTLGLTMSSVKAIFISHEHTDHISGLKGLVNKYDIPFYITPSTYKRSGLFINKLRFGFTAHEPIAIGSICVTAFPKFHDAADPHSFIVRHGDITVGVFTDIGKNCEHVSNYFRECNAAFLEANYDEEMLEKGNYPLYLKNRIRGGEGHLSNKEALEIFKKCRSSFLSHLLLSHLSKENNHPQLAQDLFESHAGNTNISIATRYQSTPLFHISKGNEPKEIPPVRKTKQPPAIQLSIFGG